MFKINRASHQPVFEQLQTQIIELFMCGLLKTGDPMPSVRVLAKELGINPNTVQKAYQELERGRIVYSVKGKGTFICEDFDAHVVYLHKQKQEFIQKAKLLRQLGVEIKELQELLQTQEERQGYDTDDACQQAICE